MEYALGFGIAVIIALTGVGAGSLTTPLLILLLAEMMESAGEMRPGGAAPSPRPMDANESADSRAWWFAPALAADLPQWRSGGVRAANAGERVR